MKILYPILFKRVERTKTEWRKKIKLIPARRKQEPATKVRQLTASGSEVGEEPRMCPAGCLEDTCGVTSVMIPVRWKVRKIGRASCRERV